jgi:type IV secretory pathway VirB2 component (pilin)
MTHFLQHVADSSCTAINGSNFCTNLPQGAASSSNLQHILQIVIGTLAAVAVLIIVIAGLNFVTAGGDSQKVAKARGTIVYALVGLVIAISAEAIVTFVLGNVR